MHLMNLNIDQFPFFFVFMNIFKDIEVSTYYMNIAYDMIMYNAFKLHIHFTSYTFIHLFLFFEYNVNYEFNPTFLIA